MNFYLLSNVEIYKGRNGSPSTRVLELQASVKFPFPCVRLTPEPLPCSLPFYLFSSSHSQRRQRQIPLLSRVFGLGFRFFYLSFSYFFFYFLISSLNLISFGFLFEDFCPRHTNFYFSGSESLNES